MKPKFFRIFALFICLTSFVLTPNSQTPAGLLKVIPQADAKINSDNLLERVEVLDALVVYSRDDDLTKIVLPYDLSPEAYAFVIEKIFEKDLTRIDVRAASQALSKIEFLIKKFALKQFAGNLASLIKNFVPAAQTDFALVGIQFGILETLKGLQAKEFAPQIAALLQPSTPRNLYREAVSTLVELRVREVVPALISLLSDKNPSQRYWAIESLVKVGAREAAPHLAGLLKDDDKNIRYAALDALVKIDSHEKYIPQIWEYYSTAETTESKAYALAALVDAKDAAAISLAMNLVTDGNDSGRGELLRRLVELKAEPIIAPLIKLLEDKTVLGGDVGTNSNIRASIIRALSDLQARAAIPVLRNTLNDRNLFLKYAAAQALGNLDAVEAVDDLMNFFRSGLPDPPDRITNFTYKTATAALALARIGDKKTWKSLIDAAENPNYPHRGQIIQELNRHLDRALWQKASEKTVSKQYIVSIREISETYSRETEIPIILHFEPGKDISKRQPLTPPYKDTKGYPWANIGGGISLLDGLREIPRSISDGTQPETFTFIFDDGRIRIMSVENAVKWWRENILTK